MSVSTLSAAAAVEEDPAGATSRYQLDSVAIPSCVTKFEDEEKRKKK